MLTVRIQSNISLSAGAYAHFVRQLEGDNPKRTIFIFEKIELYTKSYCKNSGKSIGVIKKVKNYYFRYESL